LFIDRAANHSKKFHKKKVKFCNLLKISPTLIKGAFILLFSDLKQFT
jgi:hypothetical protein